MVQFLWPHQLFSLNWVVALFLKLRLRHCGGHSNYSILAGKMDCVCGYYMGIAIFVQDIQASCCRWSDCCCCNGGWNTLTSARRWLFISRRNHCLSGGVLQWPEQLQPPKIEGKEIISTIWNGGLIVAQGLYVRQLNKRKVPIKINYLVIA